MEGLRSNNDEQTLNESEPAVQNKTREARIERVEQLSAWLDSAFEVPVVGYRIGWDTVIGLLPGVGDLATTAMSGWIINEARKLGVSRWTLIRMMANSGFDFVIGILPVAGDLFDAAFRSNSRNLALLKAAIERQQGRSEHEKS